MAKETQEQLKNILQALNKDTSYTTTIHNVILGLDEAEYNEDGEDNIDLFVNALYNLLEQRSYNDKSLFQEILSLMLNRLENSQGYRDYFISTQSIVSFKKIFYDCYMNSKFNFSEAENALLLFDKFAKTIANNNRYPESLQLALQYLMAFYWTANENLKSFSDKIKNEINAFCDKIEAVVSKYQGMLYNPQIAPTKKLNYEELFSINPFDDTNILDE